MAKRQKLIHLHNSQLVSGLPKSPSASTIEAGEIAINNNATYPALFIKNSDGGIVRFDAVDKNHTHDGRYYTESEIDTLLSGKANTGHTHNYAGSASAGGAANSAVKFSEAKTIEITGAVTGSASTTFSGITSVNVSVNHNHDDRYYTESEVDTLLGGKSGTGHTHPQYSSTAHTHAASAITSGTISWDRLSGITGTAAKTLAVGNHTHAISGLTDAGDYYKASDIDTLLAGKSGTGHTHDDRYSLTGHTHSQYSLTSHTHSQYSTTGHDHDNRYYTESEVDTLLGGKSNTGHTHAGTEVAAASATTRGTVKPGTYLQITDTAGTLTVTGLSVSNHTHDDRYYTESEVDTLLSGKANTGHTHNQYSLTSHTHSQYSTTGHNHDDKYYTEGEVDTMLAGKSGTGHTHNASAITGGTVAKERHYTPATAASDTNVTGPAVTGVRYDAYGHITKVTTGSTAHSHDDRYYTESEVDTLLGGKSNTGHTHDERYSLTGHTHAQYSLTSHTHSQYSTTGHSHDDRYYTESEVDTLLGGKSSTGHTHAAGDITSGTISWDRLSGITGTSAKTISVGNHTHAISGLTDASDYYKASEVDSLLNGKSDDGHKHVASDITGGTIAWARLSGITGTNAQTIAVGNHTHNQYSLTGHTHAISGLTDAGDYYNASEVDTLLNGKANSTHPHAGTDVSAATASVRGTVKPGTYLSVDSSGTLSVTGLSASGHIHDDRYYQKGEVDSLIGEKSDDGHKHTAGDITGGTIAWARLSGITGTSAQTIAVGNHTHAVSALTDGDDYYKKSEVDSLLNGKANSTHPHAGTDVSAATASVRGTVKPGTYLSVDSAGTLTVTGLSASGHIHDDRYYQKGEVDSLIGEKSDDGHTHNFSALTGTVSLTQHPAAGSSASTLSGASGTHVTGVKIDSKGHAVGVTTASTSHTHDDRYYTESEVNTLLADKSGTGHTHSASAITGGTVAKERHYTPATASNDTVVSGPTVTGVRYDAYGHITNVTTGSTGHNHDEKYYTKSEVDTFLTGKSNTGHDHDGRYSLTSHTHSQYSTTGHNHDERYYLKSEVDTAVDTAISNALTSSVKYLGTVSAATQTTGASSVGDMYIATASFTIASGNSANGAAQTVESGDYIISRSSGKWDVVQKNLTSAVTASSNLTSGYIVVGNGNQTVKIGDKTLSSFSLTGHTHDASDITSGTIGWDRIKGLSGSTSSKFAIGSHTTGVASTSAIGHVKYDGSTIGKNSSDQLYVIPSGHTHPQYPLTSHTHDDRYYTESEVNTLLNDKSNTGHPHAGTDVSAATASVRGTVKPGTYLQITDTAGTLTVTGLSVSNHTHPQYSLTGHTHAGSEITSAVANATSADTVDGYHVSVVTSMPTSPNANTIYILK